MNNLKLQLENFQSIAEGELEFKTGLNFIIGQSNSGKSATFRALKACLSNPKGSQRYIKNGYPSSSVTLGYNGNEITWKRNKTTVSYTINGENYLKTGNSSAFKILEDSTGFVQGSGDTIMNIEEELQLPFPFGLNKFELFKLFENVFCVSDSAVILKSAKEHESKVKFDLDLLEVELNKNNNKIEALNEFKKEIDLNRLKNYSDSCKKAQARLAVLNDGLDVIRDAIKLEQADLNISSFVLEDKLVSYNELLDLKKTITDIKSLHSLSKSLPLPLTVSSEKILLLKEKEALLRLCNQCKELANVCIPESSFENKLSILREKRETQKVLKELKEIRNVKPEIKEFKNLVSRYEDLKKYKKELKSISERIYSAENKQKEAESRLAQIEDKLKEFKVCPLCHKPLDDKGDCTC